MATVAFGRILLAVAVAAVACAAGASDDAVRLAQMPVKNLSGDETTVALHPTKGAVLVIGFTRESNESTRAWSERLDAALGFPDPPPDVVPVYSIAVVEGAPRLVLGMMRRMMRRAIPEEQHERFLLVEREADAWRAIAADAEAADEAAHVLRLDASGRICTSYVGPASDEAVGRILDAGCGLRP